MGVVEQGPDLGVAVGRGEQAARAAVVALEEPVEVPHPLFQIGALAAFLCSPAASEITGTAIPVDGGWTAH